MGRLLRTSDVAQMMGVSVESVRRFENKGFLRSIKTPLGHRRFDELDVIELMSRGSLKEPKNNASADEQGFGDETETVTMQNVHKQFGGELNEYIL
jgi:hypothetical protein